MLAEDLLRVEQSPEDIERMCCEGEGLKDPLEPMTTSATAWTCYSGYSGYLAVDTNPDLPTV